jgi:ketosteroid isomerase-like protein
MTSPRGQKFVADFRRAVAAHDAEAVVACFTEDCRFELPNHPARSFTGRDQARQNWTMIFQSVPDLAIEVRTASYEDDRCWVEWEYTGTRLDGSAHLMRGVTIVDVDDQGRLSSARFFVDYVDAAETSIGEHLASLSNP